VKREQSFPGLERKEGSRNRWVTTRREELDGNRWAQGCQRTMQNKESNSVHSLLKQHRTCYSVCSDGKVIRNNEIQIWLAELPQLDKTSTCPAK